MRLLLKCLDCGSYTLKPHCEKCQKATISPDPPRFSPQDRYGGYRRKMKKLKREA